jgi:hypothetical protein
MSRSLKGIRSGLNPKSKAMSKTVPLYDKESLRHWKEVAGKGDFPLDPEYIEKFITTKARSGPEWAIAYALLQVGYAIRSASKNIAGVDDYTPPMQARIATALEAIGTHIKQTNGGSHD